MVCVALSVDKQELNAKEKKSCPATSTTNNNVDIIIVLCHTNSADDSRYDLHPQRIVAPPPIPRLFDG
jgi:hypothetical protein